MCVTTSGHSLDFLQKQKKDRGDKGEVAIIAMMGNGYFQIVPCVVEKNREERGRGI